MKAYVHYDTLSLNGSNMRSVSDKSLKEDENTYFILNNFFFRKRHHLCENVEKYGTVGEATDDKKMWSMRIACWITKTTNTHPHRIRKTYCVSVAPVV
jgi:hypothetical protein